MKMKLFATLFAGFCACILTAQQAEKNSFDTKEDLLRWDKNMSAKRIEKSMAFKGVGGMSLSDGVGKYFSNLQNGVMSIFAYNDFYDNMDKNPPPGIGIRSVDGKQNFLIQFRPIGWSVRNIEKNTRL